MKLLSFELKKNLFSKRFGFLIIGILIAIGILLVRNIIFESNIEKDALQEVEDLLEVSYENARMHQAILENDPEDEEEKNRLLLNSSMINLLYEMRSIVGTDDWQNTLLLENEYLEKVSEYKKAEGEHPFTNREINRMFALNQKLLDENIRPEHETYSIALPNFMKQVVDIFIGFGAIIILLLLVGDILSSEFENRSFNLLLSQPLNPKYILSSKFISSVILYLLTTITMLFGVFLLGFIFGQEGTFDYPIIMEINNVITFISVFDYMVLGILLISVMIPFFISLCLLYSLLFKNTLPTFFAVVATLLVGYGVTAYVSWAPFAWFNPFQYLLPADSILYQNGQFWYQGIPVVLLLSLVLYLISRQKIKKSRID
jgi:ABC-2 type transport system permease protein